MLFSRTIFDQKESVYKSLVITHFTTSHVLFGLNV